MTPALDYSDGIGTLERTRKNSKTMSENVKNWSNPTSLPPLPNWPAHLLCNIHPLQLFYALYSHSEHHPPFADIQHFYKGVVHQGSGLAVFCNFCYPIWTSAALCGGGVLQDLLVCPLQVLPVWYFCFFDVLFDELCCLLLDYWRRVLKVTGHWCLLYDVHCARDYQELNRIHLRSDVQTWGKQCFHSVDNFCAFDWIDFASWRA